MTRRVAVANGLFDPHLQESARDMDGAGDDPLVDLVLLADIDENRSLLAETRRFAGIDLAHAGPLLLEHFLVGWHVWLHVDDILEFLVKFRARALPNASRHLLHLVEIRVKQLRNRALSIKRSLRSTQQADESEPSSMSDFRSLRSSIRLASSARITAASAAAMTTQIGLHLRFAAEGTP